MALRYSVLQRVHYWKYYTGYGPEANIAQGEIKYYFCFETTSTFAAHFSTFNIYGFIISIHTAVTAPGHHSINE